MLTTFEQWLRTHDVTIDLVTVWGLCLGFGLFGLVKAVSWWTLREQKDQTMIGVALKRQKLGEAIIGGGMATLYGMSLLTYYVADAGIGFWDRTIIRAGLFLAMVLVSWFGVQFVYHLRREASSHRTGSIPLARDTPKKGGTSNG